MRKDRTGSNFNPHTAPLGNPSGSEKASQKPQGLNLGAKNSPAKPVNSLELQVSVVDGKVFFNKKAIIDSLKQTFAEKLESAGLSSELAGLLADNLRSFEKRPTTPVFKEKDIPKIAELIAESINLAIVELRSTNTLRTRGVMDIDKDTEEQIRSPSSRLAKSFDEVSVPTYFSEWEIVRRAKLPSIAIPFSEGKQPGEKAIDYFERVWGLYRDANILYRDDIDRLGDPSLVSTVVVYCRRHGIAEDTILPPPSVQRDYDELAAIDPASRDANYLRHLVAGRERQRRHRRSNGAL